MRHVSPSRLSATNRRKERRTGRRRGVSEHRLRRRREVCVRPRHARPRLAAALRDPPGVLLGPICAVAPARLLANLVRLVCRRLGQRPGPAVSELSFEPTSARWLWEGSVIVERTALEISGKPLRDSRMNSLKKPSDCFAKCRVVFRHTEVCIRIQSRYDTYVTYRRGVRRGVRVLQLQSRF